MTDKVKPFLKWVGGKRKLLPTLTSLMPANYNNYFEPFLGGGAMFFALQPRQALLTDINFELVDCYRAVRDDVDELIDLLRGYVYERSEYYRIRDLDPFKLPFVHRASRTIYLNKTGFNGMYRVNGDGKFNVPFGRYKNPTICDEVTLRACSAVLQDVFLDGRDYSSSTFHARAGDFVYMDPPYVPASNTANFTAYSVDGFSDDHQVALAHEFARMAELGVCCMLSNSDTPRVRELYKGFNITEVKAARSINCKGGKRGVVGEVVVRNYG